MKWKLIQLSKFQGSNPDVIPKSRNINEGLTGCVKSFRVKKIILDN